MFGLSMNRFSDWLWSMNGAAVGGHVDQRAHAGAPRPCGTARARSSGSSSMPCTEPSASLSALAASARPQAERLQLVDQVAVDLEEVAGQRLALEQVRHLRLDALVAAGDRGDGRGRRDRDQQRVAQAVLARSARAARPSARSRAASTPQASNCSSPRAARVSANAGCGPCSSARSHGGRRARGSRSPRRSAWTARAPRAESNGSRSWKKTSCRPITPRPDRPPARVRAPRPARSGSS